MPSGVPHVDYPGESTGLSVVPFGQDDALTSRVRTVTSTHLLVTGGRDSVGERVPLSTGEQVELSWQADDGFRSVPAQLAAVTDEGLWKLRVTGAASRMQRREAVRAPLGLPVRVRYRNTELTGSTVDLSEGGVRCVFRPHGDLGGHIPFPRAGAEMELVLDLYSDQLATNAEFVRRYRREDSLHEWSLRFHHLPEQSADLIRSHVFTALRNARARGIVS